MGLEAAREARASEFEAGGKHPAEQARSGTYYFAHASSTGRFGAARIGLQTPNLDESVGWHNGFGTEYAETLAQHREDVQYAEGCLGW